MSKLSKMLQSWNEAAQFLNQRIDELKEENKELKEDLAAMITMIMEDET